MGTRALRPHRGAVAGLALAFAPGCSSPPDAGRGTAEVPGASLAAPVVRFVDVTAESGIDYILPSGTDSTYPMPAVMGGGLAVFDADGDADLDLYIIAPAPGGNRFYLQQEGGVFTNATAAAGLEGDGMGCAVGDLDNDGDLDLYLTRVGPDRLFVNDGKGVFADRSEAWNVAVPGWSSSAALLDYDRDGYLDVYIARYVAFDAARVCSQHGGRRDFCGPTEFEGLSDVLLHNLGGTGFEDVSAAAGITAVDDAGLGVVAADFDHDGEVDIYVANDADPNNLWIHQGSGRFLDDGVLQGSAFNRWGNSEAGMGIAVGDADLDQDLDLFVTHLITETNTYYRNLMLPGFEDATIDTELGAASLDLTGFGTAFFDADNDGDLDLAVANGAVKRRPSALATTGDATAFWSDYVEPNLLLLNEEGRFVDASALAPWTQLSLSRALVPADLDRDGDLDLVIANLDGPLQLLRNLTIDPGAGDTNANTSNWLQIRAFDSRLRRVAIGARITVQTPEGARLVHALPPGSYLSGGPATAHLGLGASGGVQGFEVVWPDGLAERFPGAAANQVVQLIRGEGQSQ
ncbi:MAG: CRTAC1 family protein [Holophagales bacterium]|nr:CRTAC1 family protein [Holophagales bacterium]MYD21772.1 CRTAC1 family protein [Holophagales bacterium]MYI32031.1 CRTAC1 family protein [Holophagales bacterium]